jgi:arylsulfatase A-like enzyme
MKPWKSVGATLLLIFVFARFGLVQSATAQPNIIIILADDLGYGDVSFNGCPDYTTPNIDSLIANGVNCPSGYVTHPFCSPSRAALLTGRYQQRFGHENQPADDNTNPRLGLPAQEVLLPQILKPAGYVCSLIGKWHLGASSNLRPLQRGFDEFYGFLGGQSEYFNAPVLRNNTPVTETAYLTDAITREGVSFINAHATQPFFLWLAYNAPHSPYEAPPSYLNRVANISDPSRRMYAAMVTALDDGVGQVMQTLKTQNLFDKTLIFFLSDNGAPRQPFTRNFPLRGYKFDVLEGGIRVPFGIQWPGRIPSHVVYDSPVSSLDIVATSAAAAGVSLPTDRVYDGMNLMPYLTGQKTPPTRTLFWRYFGFGPSGPAGSTPTMYAARSGPLKLVAPAGPPAPPQLYDLPVDIGESQNLAAAQPAAVASLSQLYAQWDAQLIAPLWEGFGQSPVKIVLAGDWNAFNKGDVTSPWNMHRITAPGLAPTPDGFDWFTSTIHVATTGGDTTPGTHSFALVAGSSYSTQWGGVPINIDGATSVPSFSGSGLAPTNTIPLQNGFYYSFRALSYRQQPSQNLTIGVMKTSAPPISVSRSGQTPAVPLSNNPVTVNIVTNQPKSPEERIYVRWSADTFVTSHLVQAVGSGVNYSAVIPGQLTGTPVQYCITTSTADLLPDQAAGAIDPLTLACSNTFKYVVNSVGGPTPTPTATPTPTPTPTPQPTPTPTPTATPAVVANPTFLPPPGDYYNAATYHLFVGMACSTPNSQEYFTTDGSTPAGPPSPHGVNIAQDAGYAGGFSAANSPVSFKVVAVKAGSTNSNVVAGTYTIHASPDPRTQVPDPQLGPAAGSYKLDINQGQMSFVVATAIPGAVMRYTLDGTTPNPSHGILINQNVGRIDFSLALSQSSKTFNLQVVAYGLGKTASNVKTFTITLHR